MATLQTYNDSYVDQVINDVYDKRKLQINNITGAVYIDSEATSYYKDFVDSSYIKFGSEESLHVTNKVKDRMRLEIVKNLDI